MSLKRLSDFERFVETTDPNEYTIRMTRNGEKVKWSVYTATKKETIYSKVIEAYQKKVCGEKDDDCAWYDNIEAGWQVTPIVQSVDKSVLEIWRVIV